MSSTMWLAIIWRSWGIAGYLKMANPHMIRSIATSTKKARKYKENGVMPESCSIAIWINTGKEAEWEK